MAPLRHLLVPVSDHYYGYCQKDGGVVFIHPKFNKLITSLRTAVEKGDGSLDKDATSFDEPPNR
jgi:hypothetical protein